MTEKEVESLEISDIIVNKTTNRFFIVTNVYNGSFSTTNNILSYRENNAIEWDKMDLRTTLGEHIVLRTKRRNILRKITK